MNNTSSFRSVNEWKIALMALPDQNFFELLRSIFGNIKTPFNKQRLMDDLYILLSREDIRKTIADYLDDKDCLVIAATALLNSPAQGELENFFSGDLSFGELHALLRNLEERLIIYRFEDTEGWHLALNPALQNVLAPFIADTSLLFPSSPSKAGEDNNSRISSSVFPADDRGMAVLLAFVEEEKIFFKAEGARKKVQDDGKRLFPDLDLDTIISILARLGLFHREGETFVPDKQRIGDFSLLTTRERQEYWAAAMYLFLNENLGSVKAASAAWETFSYSRLKETTYFIHDFMGLLDPLQRYPKITLRRYACLLAREFSGRELWGRRLFGDSPELHIEPFLETLEKCGLLFTEEEFIRCVSSVSAADTPVSDRLKRGKESAVIAMDSPVSFVLYPDISLADALAVASFCSIKEDGGLEITRFSVIRFFDHGYSSDDLIKELKRLSCSRIDSSLEFTLKDWEARYTSVSLYQGEVLVLSEDRRYLMDTRPLSSLVKKILAPGVYLLRSKGKNEVTKVLLKAGVDIFSQMHSDPETGDIRQDPDGLRFLSGETKMNKYRLSSFPSLEINFAAQQVFAAAEQSDTGQEGVPTENGEGEVPPAKSKTKGNDSAAALKRHFNEHLKGMKLSDMEREELSARIERKLVLTETQLETSALKYEKLEARGLDYNGKNILARQAIAAGSLVEVSWAEPGGEIKTIAGIPSALEKQGEESFLIIQPVDPFAGRIDYQTAVQQPDGEQPNGEEGEELRLPLGKISRLRRIKQSIFEG